MFAVFAVVVVGLFFVLLAGDDVVTKDGVSDFVLQW